MSDNNISSSNRSVPARKSLWLFLLIWLFLAYKLFSRILLVYFDSDIYHMLAVGKAMEKYGILKDDVFFLDSGHKIVIQQWLHDLFVYKVYGICGKPGILLVTLAVSILFIVLAVRVTKYYGLDSRLALTTALIVCLYSNEVFSIRPGIFTMVLLLIQMCICERYRKNKKTLVLFALPLITLIEVNWHATMWIMHFIFLLPYLVPIPAFARKYIKLEDSSISIKKLILPMLCMTASLFINPYGLDGITILFKQKEVYDMGILEMNPPELSSRFAIVMIIALLVAALLYGRVKLHSSNVFLFLGTAIMLMSNARNIQMFAIGLILISSDLWAAVPLDKIDNILQKTKTLIIVLCAALDLVLVGIMIIKTPFIYYLHDAPSDSVLTPVVAVDYLDQNASKDSRIYTDFNCGSYISWNDYKIYFCSRTEGYCPDVNGGYNLIGEYLNIFKNTEADCDDTFDKFLDKYRFDYLVVETRNKMFPYLTINDEYVMEATGNGYAVFKHVSQ